jgi:TetR/AcrR family transcriptional regulator of autoinduction and epiphytic fitness
MDAPTRLTDRKRQAILKAAAEQFRACGFEATSVDRIAAAAGVSKRTVYNHFPSKDELFAETLVQLFQSEAEALDLPYRRALGLRAQLTELLAHKLRTLAERDFIDLARIGEREEALTAWIRAAQADGRLKPGDPSFASTLLQGQIKTFAFWPQVTLGAAPLGADEQARLIEASVSMFLAYFGSGAD